MRKYSKLIFSVASACLIWFAAPLRGETVSRKGAENVAEAFFKEQGKENASLKIVFDGKRFSTHRLFPPFFVFNNASGGFVIIAADNKAYPVLGYSLSGEFHPDKMPEAMKETLSRYAGEIENIRHDGRLPVKAIEAWKTPTVSPSVIDEMFNMSAEGISDEIWMRRSAVEYPDVYQYFSEDEDLQPEEKEMAPVSLYTGFIKEITAEKERRERDFELRLIPDEPVVITEGGGVFTLRFPEKIVLAQVYNLSGMMVERIEVGDREQMIVNLGREPSGLYLLTA
ncbi:MAG: Spi family protease inhibitor, partial [Muribaculaceae bacterium]|nr:Spi family protease inhibitor [Muribaculaceae bacterium]